MWSHLKVYHSIQVWGIGTSLLVLLERSQWTRFSGIYFVSFGLKMREISKLKWFLSLQIQINYKRPCLEEKLSWEFGHTCWAYLILQKLDIGSRV
jgi:hypothetical protein